MPYLLDTNILVRYIRRDAVARRVEATYRLLTVSEIPLLSIVTEGEIRAFAAESAWGTVKMQQLENLLAYFIIVPVPFVGIIDAYVQASEYSRKAGRAVGKNDLWIAATAMATGATLLTTDKDFDHLSLTLLTRDWIDPKAS